MSENIEPIEKYGLSSKLNAGTLFSKVGICGCGTVGRSIARMVSKHGIDVIFIETSEEKIEESFNLMNEELDALINRWGLTEGEKRAIVSRIVGSTDYRDLAACDIVIETLKVKQSEDSKAIRKQIFKRIEEVVDCECIIATNATTLVVSELAEDLKCPARCVSMHFITSAPGATIVEVAKGLHTTIESYEKAKKFVTLMGKIVIPVEESPGLISVRLFVPLINDACEVLMEAVGSKDDIDLTMKLGMGMSLGPFEMADKIGLDKILRWANNLYSEFGDLKYKPSPLIKRLVRANQLGRISGQGFYKYNEQGSRISEI
ncbi:MAG: NAD-binding protein [Saprospiraceae bacterium]|nr:NAD-binding protein [Saprospiraceae bacterium]